MLLGIGATTCILTFTEHTMFNDLEFRDFRSFEKLQLRQLGRVNLVVGRNNAGKTSLLEGIVLVANPTMLGDLPGLFRANSGNRYYQWLLRDRTLAAELFGWTGGNIRQVLLRRMEPGIGLPAVRELNASWNTPGLLVNWVQNQPALRVRAVSVQQRNPDALVGAFAEAVRPAEGEAQMESLLQAVDERVRSVRIDYAKDQNAPFIVVDIGLSERVPLAQAGQGIYRLVSMFSDLLGQEPDIAFIDEIENGIHYSVLPQVWKGVAEVAKRLEVQVFATTHSRECLAAAHEAFAARNEYDLRVIQLFRVGDRTDGRVLDRKHIEAALSGEIELR
jgi:ABC-type branched-subunit amino acid transport system ATPase component